MNKKIPFPTGLTGPRFRKIVAIGGAALVLAVLGFSLLTGNGGSKQGPQAGPEEAWGEELAFSPDDFEWFDQPALPTEEDAPESADGESGPDLLLAAATDSLPGLDLGPEPGLDLGPEETPDPEPGLDLGPEETPDPEPGLDLGPEETPGPAAVPQTDRGGAAPDSAGQPGPSRPSPSKPQAPDLGPVAKEAASASKPSDPTIEEPAPLAEAPKNDPAGTADATTGNHTYAAEPKPGEIAALPAGPAPAKSAPAPPAPSPSFTGRIPPPTPPKALARSSKGVEVMAPTRPETLNRDKVFGHTRVPVTREQWQQFESVKAPAAAASHGGTREESAPEKPSAPAFVRVKQSEARDYAGWLTAADREARVITRSQKYRLPRSIETRNQTVWREEDQPAPGDESRPFGLVLATADEELVPRDKRVTREVPVRIDPRGIPVKDLPADESAAGRQDKADRPLWTRPGK